MRRGVRLRYLNRAGEWPSGNPRFYFRRPGGKNIPMPDAPMDAPAFLEAYAKAAAAKPTPTTHAPGTLGQAVTDFLASAEYAARSAGTRGYWRRHLETIRDRYGIASLRTLTPQAIRTDIARLDPHPANARLKVWRGFCRWAVDKGKLAADPARDVRKPTLPETDGFQAWTSEDVARFRAHWPIGTAQRLCLELLHRSCASIGDACALTRGHVEDGWLIYIRGKSKSVAVVPWSDPPAWFGADDLDACLEGHEHMTFLVTAAGRPRSPKAAGSWFAEACTAAGLDGLSAHGVRKYRAASFKENGASREQRMAVLGHRTEGESSRYDRSADLRRVISGTEVPTRIVQLGQKRGNIT